MLPPEESRSLKGCGKGCAPIRLLPASAGQFLSYLLRNAFEHITFAKRTLRELRILRLLQHENLIQIRRRRRRGLEWRCMDVMLATMGKDCMGRPDWRVNGAGKGWATITAWNIRAGKGSVKQRMGAGGSRSET